MIRLNALGEIRRERNFLVRGNTGIAESARESGLLMSPSFLVRVLLSTSPETSYTVKPGRKGRLTIHSPSKGFLDTLKKSIESPKKIKRIHFR